MNRCMKYCAVMLVATLATACVNSQEKTKRDMQRFLQTATGEYVNASGNTLIIVPVYARMIGLDTLFVERISGKGISERLVSLEVAPNGKRILQLAYAFATQNQWRNLHDNPELFSAMMPNDVRAAGTCDIKLSADLNSISYTCGGSVAETFTRAQRANPN